MALRERHAHWRADSDVRLLAVAAEQDLRSQPPSSNESAKHACGSTSLHAVLTRARWARLCTHTGSTLYPRSRDSSWAERRVFPPSRRSATWCRAWCCTRWSAGAARPPSPAAPSLWRCRPRSSGRPPGRSGLWAAPAQARPAAFPAQEATNSALSAVNLVHYPAPCPYVQELRDRFSALAVTSRSPFFDQTRTSAGSTTNANDIYAKCTYVSLAYAHQVLWSRRIT